MKYLLFMLTMLSSISLLGQCNQHVFTSVGATNYTYFEYDDCDGEPHAFTLPDGGYTIILCADLGTVFIVGGDGFAFPLLNEHPGYASCVQEDCEGDFDGDGVVGVSDLQTFLTNYGSCVN